MPLSMTRLESSLILFIKLLLLYILYMCLKNINIIAHHVHCAIIHEKLQKIPFTLNLLIESLYLSGKPIGTVSNG